MGRAGGSEEAIEPPGIEFQRRSVGHQRLSRLLLFDEEISEEFGSWQGGAGRDGVFRRGDFQIGGLVHERDAVCC